MHTAKIQIAHKNKGFQALALTFSHFWSYFFQTFPPILPHKSKESKKESRSQNIMAFKKLLTFQVVHTYIKFDVKNTKS